MIWIELVSVSVSERKALPGCMDRTSERATIEYRANAGPTLLSICCLQLKQWKAIELDHFICVRHACTWGAWTCMPAKPCYVHSSPRLAQRPQPGEHTSLCKICNPAIWYLIPIHRQLLNYVATNWMWKKNPTKSVNWIAWTVPKGWRAYLKGIASSKTHIFTCGMMVMLKSTLDTYGWKHLGCIY